MDYQQLKQDIIDYSKKIGIDKIGFTTADPFVEMKGRLLRQEELGYQSGFEEKNIAKRVDPSRIFHEPHSIIAIALAYPSKMKNAPLGEKGASRGIFSRSSWGEDYHKVLKDRLEKLEIYILSKKLHMRVLNRWLILGNYRPCCRPASWNWLEWKKLCDYYS